MFRSYPHLIFTLFVVLTAFGVVFAQDASTSRSGEAAKEDFPKNIQESLVKQRIEREKKDFAELLQRGEEAVKLGEELEKSFVGGRPLSAEDYKKLDRLEKLAKKIRSELGGDDDNEATVKVEDQPLTTQNAFKALQDVTVKLADELKKTTRYTVSVVAVESSNLLLKVVRFLRFDKKQ